MKGVGIDGAEVTVGKPEGPEAGGALKDLSVVVLRAFIIGLMREGGVPSWRRAEVMRCSKQTLKRDLKAFERSP